MSNVIGLFQGAGKVGSVLRAYSLGLLTTVVIVLGFATGVTSCEDADTGKVGDFVCLSCHDGGFSYDARGFTENVHAEFGLQCEDCHGPGRDHVRNGGRLGLFIDNPSDAGFKAGYAMCAECHISTAQQFEKSVHFSAEAANCFDCHNVHKAEMYTASFQDNTMCLDCHVAFEDDALLDIHIGPFHAVDLEGTGLGQCTTCHMVPNSLRVQDRALHGHGMLPVSPAETLEVLTAGETPQMPNTCAGIMGCHDPNVPGTGNPRSIDNVDLMTLLVNAYGAVGGLDE